MSGEAFEVYSVGALPVDKVARMVADEFDTVTEDGGDGGLTIAQALHAAGFPAFAERHERLIGELRAMAGVYKELCYWRAGDQGLDDMAATLREMPRDGR